VIAPGASGEFVARMEVVLDVYKRQYNPRFPVVCMDESPKQLIAETRCPVHARPGRLARIDYEYRRCGVCSIFMACEPLAGIRMVKVEERSRSREWAEFIEKISLLYPEADRITLVMDNYGTHKPGSLYERFTPEKARELMNRFEFVYTPKHGSWLNMAEIELNVLTGQCLNRRIDNIDKVRSETTAWENHRNTRTARVNWQFTAEDARIKLRRLYPTLEM